MHIIADAELTSYPSSYSTKAIENQCAFIETKNFAAKFDVGFHLCLLIRISAVECPALKNPTNGTVTYDERVYPNEAVYECENGFELSGGATRKCQIDGDWSGDAPACEPESKGVDYCEGP